MSKPAKLVGDIDSMRANAFLLADAIHNGELDMQAVNLVARGWVYYPFRYRNHLAFAPAKFIGYEENSIASYARSVGERSGSKARAAISKVLGHDAIKSIELDHHLKNYCASIGVELQNKKHSFWVDKSIKHFVKNDHSAVNDIDNDGIGNPDPDYKIRMAGYYVRDLNVRKAVLIRANGFCESCGQPGFLKPDGSRYLEGHHVIKLSEQGPDQPHNVIALCANDHRRAHFGADWKEANDSFLEILEKFRADN